jgi:hypothetical protein
MLGRHAPLQGRHHLGPGGLEPPAREGRQPRGIGLARHQRREDGAARLAEPIAEQPRELEVGVLQGLLQAQGVPPDLADQLLAGPGQVAQLLDGRRRHEAAPNQPMGQQIGDPGRIGDIALAAGNVPDVHRGGQDQLALPGRVPSSATGPGRLARDR